MSRPKQNYYGSLCAEMYEILHETAPREELDFYLSYAEKGKKILEKISRDYKWRFALRCGSKEHVMI